MPGIEDAEAGVGSFEYVMAILTEGQSLRLAGAATAFTVQLAYMFEEMGTLGTR